MKGAAASFGIITEFVVHTEPAPEQLISYSYHIEIGKKSSFANTFAAWQDIIKDPGLDRKFSTEVVILELGMIISGQSLPSPPDFVLTFYRHLLWHTGRIRRTQFRGQTRTKRHRHRSHSRQLAGCCNQLGRNRSTQAHWWHCK